MGQRYQANVLCIPQPSSSQCSGACCTNISSCLIISFAQLRVCTVFGCAMGAAVTERTAEAGGCKTQRPPQESYKWEDRHI